MRARSTVIAVFLFGLFALLIVQFYKIQVLEERQWTERADKQHFFVVQDPAIRGTFYSNVSVRTHHPEIPQKLVVDITKYHLFVDPHSIPKSSRKVVSGFLLAHLPLTPAEQLALPAQFEKKSRSRKLAMWLDKDDVERIMNWWLPYSHSLRIPKNALFFVSDYQRSYPFGKLLGNVLHTIQNAKDEISKQAVPTGGLELYFDDFLQGSPGSRRLMRSPRNSFETGEVLAEPCHGSDIYLTINHCLQAITEEELEKGVKNCKAKGGWAVMMNPFTGEVLALAQYPFFNPSEYQKYFNDPLMTEATKVKAATDANEPGSVMKPLTITAALLANETLIKRGEKPLFSPDEKMPTSNSRFPGRSKPLVDTSLHYFLNMNMAIQRSSNIYMARLVERIIERLGPQWYRNVLQQVYGMGEKTGLELPSESNGVLPTPGKKHPNGALEWSVPTPFSMAMGHNVQVTSLQLARAIAILANGGYKVQPTLVSKVTSSKGDVLLDHSLAEKKRVLEPHIVKQVVEAMKYSTKPGGTCRRMDIWGYTEAGKSGSAKKIVNGSYSETLYCSSAVGFTPVTKPAFVLVVTMDEPEYGYIPGIGRNHLGGCCAAPVFREIASRSLEYLGIPLDDPYGYPVGDPRYNADKADWKKETRVLQEMYEKWNKR